MDYRKDNIIDFLRENYGFNSEDITKIKNGVMNSNFYFTANEKKYLFKIYEFRNSEEVSFEIEVLEHLKRKKFPCPRLARGKTGGILATFHGKPALVYEYIEGYPLRKFKPGLMREVGALMALMHRSLIDCRSTGNRQGWDGDGIKALVKNDGKKLVERGFPGAENLIAFLEEELAGMSFPDDLPGGITHQDIKPENIIVCRGKAAGFIDFDNARHGAFLHDITTMIIWSCFENGTLNTPLVHAMLRGYEEERPLGAPERKNLDKGIRFRLLREAFITPLVTVHGMDEAKKRSDYFLDLYKKLP